MQYYLPRTARFESSVDVVVYNIFHCQLSWVEYDSFANGKACQAIHTSSGHFLDSKFPSVPIYGKELYLQAHKERGVDSLGAVGKLNKKRPRKYTEVLR